MKLYHIIISLALLSSINLSAKTHSNIEKDNKLKLWSERTFKETKKNLRFERDSLKQIIDSLKYELENNYTPIYQEDSINLGAGTETDIQRFKDSLHINGLTQNSDSLLNFWYCQEGLFDVKSSANLDDSIDFVSEISDSLILDRLQKMNSFIPIEYNRLVRNHIVFYTQKIKKQSAKILGLSRYYMPIFEDIFNQYDMPEELKAMAIIESSLNPTAVSRARAKGMWQFMYSTAKRYDLTINSYVDERFDPIKSAHSAAKYLQDSYQIFGDWTLAIASYNCGAGNVNKAIRRSGGKKNFWDIYYFLPKETRGYVPAFMAALYLLEYYPESNISPEPISMPAYMDTLVINKMLHFDQISHFTGISKKDLQRYNPQYLHDIIPGVEREYELKLPYQYINNFIDNEDSLYTWKAETYFNPSTLKKIKETGSASSQRIIHRVKSGETLGHIAMKYHVSVNNIKRWNGLRNNNIRIGQRLSIYRGGGPSYAKSASTKTTKSKGYIWYTVKSGDTISGISSRFKGTSINMIFKLNNINSRTKIYPGMKLKIKKA